MKVERILLTEPPSWIKVDPTIAPWARTGDWPAWWIRPAQLPKRPFCAAYLSLIHI